MEKLIVVEKNATHAETLHAVLEGEGIAVDFAPNPKNPSERTLADFGLLLDQRSKRCYVDGREVKLRRKEFEILAFLLMKRGHILSREEILTQVWSPDVVVLDRTIDVNITRLRKSIAPYGSHIVTRSGYGYGFLL